MLKTILRKCDERQRHHDFNSCFDCSYSDFCTKNCEECLKKIHFPSKENGIPNRKYDCVHMSDFYTCKYSCRYASEIIYALKRIPKISNIDTLKVLSIGCGPCTDLFAIDTLYKKGELRFNKLEYLGVDSNRKIWSQIHSDILNCKEPNYDIRFNYYDVCEGINNMDSWTPNLIILQYVFSDMNKHTQHAQLKNFIDRLAISFNQRCHGNACIILNDINLSIEYGGGREYFDLLYQKIKNSSMLKGHFRDDNSRSPFYPNGYPYGKGSEGEFAENGNFYDITPWLSYHPYATCASAQMIIKKEL